MQQRDGAGRDSHEVSKTTESRSPWAIGRQRRPAGRSPGCAAAAPGAVVAPGRAGTAAIDVATTAPQVDADGARRTAPSGWRPSTLPRRARPAPAARRQSPAQPAEAQPWRRAARGERQHLVVRTMALKARRCAQLVGRGTGQQRRKASAAGNDEDGSSMVESRVIAMAEGQHWCSAIWSMLPVCLLGLRSKNLHATFDVGAQQQRCRHRLACMLQTGAG